MKTLGLILIVLSITPVRADILDPNGTPDPTDPRLHAWYDASEGVNGSGQPVDGDPVVRWDDRSPNGRDLTRISADPSEYATFLSGVANGWPAVRFDGDDYIWASVGDFGSMAGAKTVFIVGRVDVIDGGYLFDGSTIAGRNALFAGQSSSPGQWVAFTGNEPVTVGSGVDSGIYQVHSLVLDRADNTLYLNGDASGTGNAALDPLGGLILGARYNLAKRLTGDIAEVLVYETALSNEDRTAVESYLLDKHPIVVPPPGPEMVDVFTSGDGLYNTYRIPAILTTETGMVLAFAEGRATASDHAMNDIVMRRSDDGGVTWGQVQVLHDDGGNSLNNPCVLQVREGPHAGRILLMYQRYPEGCHESCVVEGYDDPNICRGFLMHSDDDGVTWSMPLDVTVMVKRPTGATSIASGPGVGIQIRRGPHAGRLIVPFNQGPGPAWKVYAVYSDDGGDTWAWGDLADDTNTPGTANEVQMVELVDGTLMLNSRSSGGTQHRKVAFSQDGGETWSPLQDDDELIEPQCMASILRYTDPLDGYTKSRLLFAGPNSSSARVNGTIHVSYDEGDSWPTSRSIYPGAYAYSVLTVIDCRTIAVLFERDSYAYITLARTSLDWVTSDADSVEGTPPCPDCPTDIDGDGMTDIDDLLVVLGSWGPCKGSCPGDVVPDGVVAVDDLLLVVAAFGPCP